MLQCLLPSGTVPCADANAGPGEAASAGARVGTGADAGAGADACIEFMDSARALHPLSLILKHLWFEQHSQPAESTVRTDTDAASRDALLADFTQSASHD